jgi:hypothetical protein
MCVASWFLKVTEFYPHSVSYYSYNQRRLFSCMKLNDLTSWVERHNILCAFGNSFLYIVEEF